MTKSDKERKDKKSDEKTDKDEKKDKDKKDKSRKRSRSDTPAPDTPDIEEQPAQSTSSKRAPRGAKRGTSIHPTHLQLSCPTYAARCFMAGILPADAFRYPEDADWFIATLQTLEATGVNEPSTAKAGGLS